MAKLTEWIKKTVSGLVDPDREERIQRLTVTIQQAFASQQQNFTLAASLRGQQVAANDLKEAKERVFRTALERGWKDGKLTTEERHAGIWIASRLEIDDATAKGLQLEYAMSQFGIALAQAMEDNRLDAAEEAQLRDIAGALGMSLPDFAGRFFRTAGESFLRNIFLCCISDGVLLETEWKGLLTVAQKLGISRAQVLQAIQPQAQHFVEHVLADAKADSRLSPQEDAALQWLLANVSLHPVTQAYVQREMDCLRALTAIEDGRLPSLDFPQGVETRAGEILHYYGPAAWQYARRLKSGAQTEEHHGKLTLTDNRVIFSSASKSQSISYRRVVSHRGSMNRLEVEIEGKPTNVFELAEPSPIPYAIFRVAVAIANQTRTTQLSGPPTRHIPRDVRQRVWQRFGGRCAECSADDYLEFDHVIPVAKGGSNSDANVQLLCRRCNLKKSDHI